MNETPGQVPLWGDDDPMRFAANPTEQAVIAAINELAAASELTKVQQALATVCRSLGRNIDAGNIKGRAIANEATQLAALLSKLAGIDEADPTAGPITVPQQTKELIDALATPPRLDTPTASYSPEL